MDEVLTTTLLVVEKEVAISTKLPSVLNVTGEDIQMLLEAQYHISAKNCGKSMEPYVRKRCTTGKLSVVRSVFELISGHRIYATYSR